MKILRIISCLATCCLISICILCGPTKAKEKITITAPDLGSKVLIGDTLSIKWVQTIVNPIISYNFNKGTGGWQSFSHVIPVNSQESKVVLPISWFSDSFQVKVEDPTGTYETSTSPLFSLKYIIIKSPLTNQQFSKNQTVTITWKAYPAKLTSLRLMLSTTGATPDTVFKDMLTNSISTTDTAYTWTVGSEPGWTFSFPSQNCVLKIRDYGNNELRDMVNIKVQ